MSFCFSLSTTVDLLEGRCEELQRCVDEARSQERIRKRREKRRTSQKEDAASRKASGQDTVCQVSSFDAILLIFCTKHLNKGTFHNYKGVGNEWKSYKLFGWRLKLLYSVRIIQIQFWNRCNLFFCCCQYPDSGKANKNVKPGL